jgi:flagellar assembly factor FliW
VLFAEAPLGLAPLVSFTLADVADAPGLHSLTATDDSTVRLFVLDAAVHLADYRPHISDAQQVLLDLTEADDASVLVVVNPAGTEPTINLLAPIVLNARTGLCHQIILEDQEWPVAAPLRRAL